MTSPDPAQYDAFAEGYEAHAEASPYNALYDRPATLALLGDVSGLRVLDAGCGPGLYLEQLLAGGADVVGCDASVKILELARRRVGPNADLRVHALEEPFDWIDDATVDVVLCALAYHYLNDRSAFLAEARRMLRPGGALVISTIHPTYNWLRLGGSYFLVAPVTETWSTGWEIAAWRMPLTRMTEEFAAAGFLIERLLEPTPAAAMATSHPDTYEQLSTEPDFILFKLRK